MYSIIGLDCEANCLVVIISYLYLVRAGSGSDGQTTAEDRHHQLGESGPHTM